MDYEKAYKKALEKAREYWETDTDNTLDIKAKGTMEYLFPELAESEDERIRKEIIAVFKGEIPFTSEEDAKKYIAWLEKQEGCEHIKKEWLEYIKQSWYKEGFIDGKYSGGTSKEWTINDTTTLNELIDFLENGTAKLQHDLTRYTNWLKIQFTPIEKQSEQKPADKLESKFKVGDWITNGDYTWKVTAIQPLDYILQSQNGNTVDDTISYVDEYFHLWTIQDAKNGDVLTNGKMIVIFKHFEDPSYRQHIVAYIGLDRGGDIQITDDTWRLGIDKAKPATKEQRDLLFQKMKEAGYEWDAEKKELKLLITNGGDFDKKNCEQKPEHNVEGLARGEDYGIDGLWHAINILEKTFGDVSGYQSDDGILEHECAISAVKELYDKKPTWSENEIKMLDNLITYLNGSKGLLEETKSIYTDLLKSLKERIKNA